MNIAILGSRGFPSTYGGFETLVRHLARDWTADGHEVTVYCRSRGGRRRVWTEEGVRCCWTPGRDSMHLSTLSFGASAHLHALTQRYDAALVLNVANGYFLPLLRARGIPCAVNTDGIEWARGKWGRTARSVFRVGAKLSARYADVLIADSQAIAAIWEDLFGVESEFIPYGAPVLTDVGSEHLDALDLTPDSYVLVVARLIPENNVDLALDAIERIPQPCPVVVAGSANHSSPLERRLRQLDDSRSVRWLGHVDDQALLAQLWANCGVYVHGHSVGGTNPGLLQAMGAGAPTLALDTAFNREVLASDAQLFPHDPDVLAGRISEILERRDLRTRYAEHGRRVVAERYQWRGVTERYMDALRLAQARAAARRQWVTPEPASQTGVL
jgi:glycosyltransferase involved in cell wall biosynthesis